MSNNHISERITIQMDGNNTPGSAAKCTNCDLNCACIPASKAAGGNLKATEQSIRSRFALDNQEGD